MNGGVDAAVVYTVSKGRAKITPPQFFNKF